MRQVAGPHHCSRLAAVEHDTHGNFRLLHHALSFGFLIGRTAPTVFSHQHIVEIEFDAFDFKISDACITDGGKDAAEVRV